ncbi:type III-D CRISPR-associated protein Csx19 [Sinosporangium siamense]|uniref:Uncharacterized protein n=1 Tax=Sinosporangium siamense TaxID=1367973 RepID=A0A919RC00_9ACTN|nr:CRISPR-associated protein Csx19 [Sinosporangium siamense]GII91135.1 hypothetical protein Ssi02_13660 [Sinosporangium siamense]
MTVLYSLAARGVSLPQLVESEVPDGACALLTAPSAYHVATVRNGECVTPIGPVDLTPVYEARFFTPDREVRWVESGSAVLLTEEERAPTPIFDRPLPALEAVQTIDGTYLIWGSVGVHTAGWASLRSNRTADPALPMAHAAKGDRVELRAKEYVVVDPEHGSAYVAEERLVGFAPHRANGAA